CATSPANSARSSAISASFVRSRISTRTCRASSRLICRTYGIPKELESKFGCLLRRQYRICIRPRSKRRPATRRMRKMDALDLARLQFAFTMACHIIFPAFSIGLASYLAVLEGLWLATGGDVYLQVYRYWLRIFAVVFGMGVVSGIVMSYQ